MIVPFVVTFPKFRASLTEYETSSFVSNKPNHAKASKHQSVLSYMRRVSKAQFSAGPFMGLMAYVQPDFSLVV